MEKVKVTVSGILGMLEAGKDRDVIAEELGLSKSDIKEMFKHPKLKGRKVRKVKEVNFILEDDVVEESEIVSEDLVEVIPVEEKEEEIVEETVSSSDNAFFE